MGNLDGKVALITGGARGQGRSHATTLARAGADIIVLDICADLPWVPYPMATEADMTETAAQVHATGRKCVAKVADVRDSTGMADAVNEAVAELGRLDIAIANAGIISWHCGDHSPQKIFEETLAVNLTGVWNTFEAAVPHITAHGDGGSLIVIGSNLSTSGKTLDHSPGQRAYVASKHGVIGLMRNYALQLGPSGIRVNAIEPMGCKTPMLTNQAARSVLDKGVPEQYDVANVLGVRKIEPEDISNAVEFLVSDKARAVTGVEFPVEAGFGLR